jgi:hypothetical protein
MRPRNPLAHRLLLTLLAGVVINATALAGVSRVIQDKYRHSYENRALFLKFPVYGEKQFVFITGRTFRVDPPAAPAALKLKVGDQARITAIDFGGDDIRFRLSTIAGVALTEIVYKFDAGLLENFPNSDVFDDALAATFTEALKFSDLEDAKRGYVEDQFDRAVREMAQTGGTTREAVLKAVAPRLPAYQDAMKDIENLRARSQDLSSQLSQSQTENRRLETELRNEKTETSRLKAQAASLQEKIDNSTTQLSRLGDDLRSARGQTQGTQRELANIQRAMNIRLDPSRDIASQIAELGNALRRAQKENDTLASQNTTLKSSLDAATLKLEKLTNDLEDAKASGAQMRETIATLSSKEDSLARQYIQLKQVKENLDTLARSVEALDARVVDETSVDGVRAGKAQVYLRNTLLGTVEYRLPESISAGAEAPASATFTSESIDYVKLAPEERQLLRSLGDKLRVQLRLTSHLQTVEVRPDPDEPVHDIGERDRADWKWKVANRGTKDGWLRFELQFTNRNKETIAIFEADQHVAAASVVRQVRSYLQPVPLAAGAVFGMVLFAIGRLFVRPHGPRQRRTSPPPAASHGPKEL